MDKRHRGGSDGVDVCRAGRESYVRPASIRCNGDAIDPRPDVDISYAKRRAQVDEAGRANNISYDLLESIARVESGLNSKALHVNRNGTTDLGLMQINSAWIDPMHLNREELIADPCYNVMAGARILRQCIDKHGYTWEAVGCYNAKSKGKRVGYSWRIFRELNRILEDAPGWRSRSNH